MEASSTQLMIVPKNIRLLFIQIRPKQWSKNLLVFSAPLFSIQKLDISIILNSVICFLLFCFISGCVYILNDYVDREADRIHPEKKNRPMASGELNPLLALSFGIILFFISIIWAYNINFLLLIVLVIYFILNVLYSLKLKHVVIFDILIIATGFVLRAIGGGLSINVNFTPWFLLCTLLLALFLAISKRKHELLLLEDNKGIHRKVLMHYSKDLLNQMTSIVSTAAIMSYSIFTFTSGHSVHLMWTIPFVIFGIFRYLYLIEFKQKGGSPEKVLIEDKQILSTVVLFGVSSALILYFFG
ncbi:decaprenyl-phosphate phosphoribosyltransferase [Paenibacillus xylanexedens]|uniref:decaprenyl-phosphate phosphoribosyltransferase n=1 Tax=Paenibacillus xylanexedens TaxID=528191 RepID=UPI003D06546B